MLTAGDTLADYTLHERLGGGGSAVVFLAERPGAPRVALKVLRPDGHDTPRARRRLEQERVFASKLKDDPHVVAPLDGGVDPIVRSGDPISGPLPWLALEFIDGAVATTLVPRVAEPDLPAIVRALVDTASALDHCHRLGVLHRDVKPGNILLAGRGEHTVGYLTDFGTAQTLDPPATVLDDGQVDASIPYAAPELLQARDLSPQTDEYAFAATAFELLTGRTPFRRSTAAAMAYAQLHDRFPAPDRVRRWLPSSLTSVFVKALAHHPEQRYDTCGEPAEIIRRAVRDLQPPVRKRRRW